MCSRAFVAFVLLALVGWPERHEYVDNFRGVRGGGGAGMDRRFFARDASLRVLVDAIPDQRPRLPQCPGYDGAVSEEQVPEPSTGGNCGSCCE